MIDTLNAKFSQPNVLRFEAGSANFPKAILTHASGSRAEVYLYGAHITSFVPSSSPELFYLSSSAEFAEGKAIRGGMPLIFPQFGPGQLPSHGFARNRSWEVIRGGVDANNSATLLLGLKESDSTRGIWPHRFTAEFEIRLSSSLETIFRVNNTNASELSFQCALHTYFAVSGIENATVHGLQNLEFLDNSKNKERAREVRKTITVSSEVDRVYLKAPDSLRIEDSGHNRSILIEKQNLGDAVLWNPWIDKGASLKDLESEGYTKFVCLETGVVEPAKLLAPGKTFEASQRISVNTRKG